MEKDYNWNLILKSAVPFALIDAYLFYTSISDSWKWISLAISLSLAGMIIYINDKKKSNIFTAMGIVFLVALIVKFLEMSEIFH